MGQPIIYPAPFVVRNTFIDFNEARPPSLDEFVQVRQVRSCPTSAILEPEGEQALPGAWPYHPAGQGMAAPLACYAVAPVAEGCAAPCAVAGPVQGSAAVLAPQVVAAHGQAVHHVAAQVPVQRCWLPTGVQGARPAEGSFQAPPPARAALVQPPPAGQEELPSAGSAGHFSGQCRPCAFVNSRGCVSGKDCQFCHLCEPGEKKRRQKEKKAFFNTMRQLQQSVRDGWPSRWA